ncbi:hypothetical protein Aros01_05462 [Streptosporangium roseum]|uniref:Uncharacterized protein n=1 Tax=Streptosporangium roseum (strain ATCC 12428 / DSM 43021 / JCM 3005 / KCTC 9067 / NCIMB 10171 / NRRL 2505 / NI 9100) TaxID=479432 RepID=D2AV36_STRRD|nr:hypothetical protein Sros_3990 [Streptosporangium roseum DSM 43021]
MVPTSGSRGSGPPRAGAGAAPGETTLIPQMRDITEMVCVMIGILPEMGWVPPEIGNTAFRMAPWRTYVPTPDRYHRLP